MNILEFIVGLIFMIVATVFIYLAMLITNDWSDINEERSRKGNKLSDLSEISSDSTNKERNKRTPTGKRYD